ncbi:unnamed protein product [Moneuplotes crassus]|uniref:Uncharacterized protein n=1 Tax=Euplotes crassus TaxID=5936 RepID=A0AAD1XXW8_EUPCR|nr:unnamed protein product [Moneuplotes crassus]
MCFCCCKKNRKCRLLPCKRFCCCCNLSKGVKCVIILYNFVFLVFLSSFIIQILLFNRDQIDCGTLLGHVQSAMCGIFGKQHFMVVLYPMFITLLYCIIAGFGIYVWHKKFQIFLIEEYFYMVFIFVGFENINNAIAIIAINNNNFAVLTLIILVELAFHSYLAGIVYSFLLEKDTEYRVKRREEGESLRKTTEIKKVDLNGSS